MSRSNKHPTMASTPKAAAPALATPKKVGQKGVPPQQLDEPPLSNSPCALRRRRREIRRLRREIRPQEGRHLFPLAPYSGPAAVQNGIGRATDVFKLIGTRENDSYDPACRHGIGKRHSASDVSQVSNTPIPFCRLAAPLP